MHRDDDQQHPATDPVRQPEIMANLPRKRPQRRSALRDQAQVQAARTEPEPTPTRSARFERPAEPPRHERAAPAESPSLADLAVEGAVEALKVPLKVGAEVTFKALDAIARSLRSR